MRPNYQKSVAMFVRGLLSHDEQLIKFDRQDLPESDFDTNYIVVNGSNVSNKTSSGKSYDGENEIMTYNDAYSQGIILEFYGKGAYSNAESFSLLSKSQAASDLKKSLGISISNVTSTTDVKQIVGSSYGNRVHIEFNVQHCPNVQVSTLRVDVSEVDYLVNN